MNVPCALCGEAAVDTDDDLILKRMIDHVMSKHWHGGTENHGWDTTFLACWREAVDYIHSQQVNRRGLMISTTI
jgi:hypothetical protein